MADNLSSMLGASAKEPSKGKATPTARLRSTLRPTAAQANAIWQHLATRRSPLRVQAKLAVGRSDDPAEHEADRIADQIMRMPEPLVQTKCAACAAGSTLCPECEEEARIQRKPDSRVRPHRSVDGVLAELDSGSPLDPDVRRFFEPRFGANFDSTRVHTGSKASEAAAACNARAFALGNDLVFAPGQYRPSSADGRRLLAHELVHTLQQSGIGRAHGPAIQRQPSNPTATPDPLTAALTDGEWRGVDIWLSRGEVGIDPLTADADHNADLVAGAIFCGRFISSPHFGEGDPLLCVLNEVTALDPRVQALKREVTARGPIIHWPAVSTGNRLAYVMNLLVGTYHYPVNGAAGIVGNLYAESGVLPSRIEGSAAATPMRASNFAGTTTDFNPEEVMNRSGTANPRVGPRMPGVGLAQWTTPARRSGLFSGGSSILFNMDGQVSYLVGELQANAGLNASLTAPGVTVNDASDNVVYQFEIPGSILDANRNRRPRADPAVQTVFNVRRALAQRALAAHQAAQAR